MENVADRRSQTTSRVPIDVPVEVVHAGYSEPYEGDALNVGVGGLSLRAPYLPEVGAQLSCRFISPVDGAVVETTGEVVWTEDRGPHIGEFGVRFLDVEEPSRKAITGMVRAWGDMMTDHDVDQGQASQPSLPPADGVLHVEGVASPIQTTVVHDSLESSILEQELPFLQLGRAVTMNDGARQGILSSVSLHTQGDLPRLVLGIEWEPQYEPAVAQPKEDTLHDFEAPTFEGEEAAVEAFADHDDFDDMGILVGDVSADNDATKMDLDEELASMGASLKPSIAGALGTAKDRAVGILGLIWATLMRLGKGLAPLRERVGRELPVALGHARVWLRKKTAPVLGFVRTTVNAIRIRLGMKAVGHGRAGKRRRTSLPPRGRAEQQSTRRQQGGEREQPARRRRVPVAPIVVVCLAAGLGVYALSPAEGEAADSEASFEGSAAIERVEVPSAGTRRIAPPATAMAAPEPDPESAPEANPTSAAPTEAVTPRMPTALPEPSRQAGPLGQEPGATTAEPAPEAAAAAPSGREFGSANVPDGRVFRLRMSLPIESFQGTATANGFEVTVPESLSLDRAGPIAAAHPDVERAMVLNRGDHAELSIRFVEGRTPPYRVRARGATLEITIGR